MIRKSVVIAGMAAGFALLSPVAALAGDQGVDHKLTISVSGSTITLHGTCAKPNEHAEGNYGVPNGHEPFGAGTMKANGIKQSISFKGVKPGKYIAWMFCDSDGEGSQGTINSKQVAFTVAAPKPAAETKAPQVAEKPKGAPQTGGGAEAANDAGIGTAALGAGAALALGGGGFFALRRRASRR
ncbi:hypothetical protein [Amycolatopsis sp. NPDC059657]|uniref:hypothetical protein n=1 Tax=Amycolatopsis sp. NPDC059657 TaxID=3346899 RepID=UPI00366FF4FB